VQILLEAEPNNPYDPWAVRVLHAESRKFIGRVPALYTKDIAILLKEPSSRNFCAEAISRSTLKISISE
jgi:hypothetical protein